MKKHVSVWKIIVKYSYRLRQTNWKKERIQCFKNKKESIIFFNFIDENIIYKSGPNKKNGSVIIHGCGYRYDKRNTPPIHSYWLFNGARVNSNGKEGDGTATRTNDTFRTPSYTIDSYEKVGSYQCELFIEIFNLTFTSTNIFVGLPDLPGKEFETLNSLQLLTSPNISNTYTRRKQKSEEVALLLWSLSSQLFNQFQARI